MKTTLCNDELADVSLQPPPEPLATAPAEKHTYGQILKSSVLVGGSSLVNIGIGIFRTKAMALLLGPAGFGLFGLFGSIVNLTQSISGMGINSSGVRQIAEAAGSGDTKRIALTTAVLRRTSILLGLLGAGLLVVFSSRVSSLTFGSKSYAAAISLLSVAVCFQLIAAGQGALIQGMRRIADLAKMSVLGALFGTVISVPLAYAYRERAVVPSLVAIAATTIVTSWWYSRKIQVSTPPMKISEVGHEAAALLKLGLAFMSSGLITLGVAYAVRITVLHQLGLAATGFYQSAWNLGGLYVGFILQAMAADFYPRLTTSAHDNTACNRLVNEQTRVGLLLAGPGVIATLTFAPLVIALFYSAKFGAAVGILRWICLGTVLQVITWPMGFIIVAKGKNTVFFLSELAWGVVSLALARNCITYFHLNGAGMAFFGSYVFHGLLIYPIVRRLSGFRWSADNRRTGALFLSAIAVVFCIFYILPLPWAFGIGTVIGIASGIYSARALIRLVPTSHVRAFARKLLVLCRLAPAVA